MTGSATEFTEWSGTLRRDPEECFISINGRGVWGEGVPDRGRAGGQRIFSGFLLTGDFLVKAL